LTVRRRWDVPNEQIDQGCPIDVVAKSSVFEDLPTVFSDESVIGAPGHRCGAASNSIIFGLGEPHPVARLSFAEDLLPNVIDVPERGEAEAIRGKAPGSL
jgi:hypothetical protein